MPKILPRHWLGDRRNSSHWLAYHTLSFGGRRWLTLQELGNFWILDQQSRSQSLDYNNLHINWLLAMRHDHHIYIYNFIFHLDLQKKEWIGSLSFVCKLLLLSWTLGLHEIECRLHWNICCCFHCVVMDANWLNLRRFAITAGIGECLRCIEAFRP